MPVQVNIESFLVRWNAEQQLLYFYQWRPPCPEGRNCKQFEEVLTSSSPFLSSPTRFNPNHWLGGKRQWVDALESAPFSSIILCNLWGTTYRTSETKWKKLFREVILSLRCKIWWTETVETMRIKWSPRHTEEQVNTREVGKWIMWCETVDVLLCNEKPHTYHNHDKVTR